MKLIASNKHAAHNFFLEDAIEAGIALKGTEIKSIRAGKTSIQDAYVRIKDNEAFIINMHISPYAHGNRQNHDETRERKLLLHKREIARMGGKIAKENYTVIPTKVYLKDGLCKIEIALAKGKKLHDKRRTLKEKDMKRQMEKAMSYKNQ